MGSCAERVYSLIKVIIHDTVNADVDARWPIEVGKEGDRRHTVKSLASLTSIASPVILI